MKTETTLITHEEYIARIVNRLAKFEKALISIADNTCCDSCREAAKVARKALGYD